ncbi:phenylacetate--CoA ligase family protein [Ornithinimicrobium panacihumi]|uniref:phenylacetate--CoA ligase family protein n=1 Tax=Ornithinimicrobium panacihumi TaxID=2008449 RepID=UPI003F8BE3BD
MISTRGRDAALLRIYALKSGLAQRPARRAAEDMARAESLSPDALGQLQRERARDLLRHAYDTVPYYAETFDAAGLGRGDLDRDDSWSAVPVLTKSAVKEHQERLVSPGLRGRGLVSSTGGSTGQPLRVLHDRSSPIAALWWRAYRWWGVGPGLHEGFVNRQRRGRLRTLAHDAQWWPARHLYLDAQGMGPQEMDSFVARWNRVRPSVLTGYVEGVHQLAQHVRRTGSAFAPPLAIAVTASVLHPSQRQTVEHVLGAPVHDCYRSAEVPWIAAQCQVRSGLHVMADHRIVEIVDDDGAPAPPGQLGHVLVTDLSNLVFPLIRYRIGDRATALADDCPCGRGLPLVSPVDGREVDVLRGPEGHVVAGGLSALFSTHPGVVEHFQIEQAADYSITLRYVPGSSSEEAAAVAGIAARRIETMLHDTVTVQPLAVAEIAHQGGKTRLVVSHVHD